MDEWAAVESERLDLATDLAGIPDAASDAPSLCTEWKVRDVVGHLVWAERGVWLGAGLIGLVKNGCSFDRYVARAGMSRAGHPSAFGPRTPVLRRGTRSGCQPDESRGFPVPFQEAPCGDSSGRDRRSVDFGSGIRGFWTARGARDGDGDGGSKSGAGQRDWTGNSRTRCPPPWRLKGTGLLVGAGLELGLSRRRELRYEQQAHPLFV